MLINQIASVLRILAFINLFGWMLYLGVVMNAQSKAVKVWLKCRHCGQEFSKTKREIEKFQYQLVDNQLAYQCECPHCHQTERQTVVQHHPGNDQETMAKTNQKMWQRALWIAILPAIFAVLLPIILIGYAPLLVIVLIIKKVRK